MPFLFLRTCSVFLTWCLLFCRIGFELFAFNTSTNLIACRAQRHLSIDIHCGSVPTWCAARESLTLKISQNYVKSEQSQTVDSSKHAAGCSCWRLPPVVLSCHYQTVQAKPPKHHVQRMRTAERQRWYSNKELKCWIDASKTESGYNVKIANPPA